MSVRLVSRLYSEGPCGMIRNLWYSNGDLQGTATSEVALVVFCGSGQRRQRVERQLRQRQRQQQRRQQRQQRSLCPVGVGGLRERERKGMEV